MTPPPPLFYFIRPVFAYDHRHVDIHIFHRFCYYPGL